MMGGMGERDAVVVVNTAQEMRLAIASGGALAKAGGKARDVAREG